MWVSSGLLGLALLVAAWTVYSVPWSEPRDIRVTNVVDRSATVTWVTDEATAGAVIYGEDDYFMPWLFAGYGKYVAYEDRDIVEARLEAASARSEALDDIEGAEVSFEEISEQIEINELGSYYVHHVTLVGLEPEKTYYFMVGNGRRFEISSEQFASDYTITEEYSFTTYKELDDMVTPNPSYGTVLSTGGAVDDGVIFMTIDGLPGSPVSAALNDEGAWYIDLANMRTMDGERLTGWDELTSSELMFVEAGVFGQSEQITNPMSVDAPADPIPVLVEEASSSSNGGNRLVSFVQAITVVDGDQSVECNNRGGTCMDKSGCEDWVTGLCPGGSNWICCTQESSGSTADYVSCPSGQNCSTSYKCSEQEGGTPGSEECADGKYCCDTSGSSSGSETGTDPCPSGFHETDYTSWQQCSNSVTGEGGAYCCKDSGGSSGSSTYDDSMCDAIGGDCMNPSSCTGSGNKVYYGLCGGGADRRCCAPVAVQEDSNPTESGCGEVRCGPDASSCWNSGKDGGRNPSCNWAKCNESGKWEAVSNCCGSCAQPSSGGSGGSQSGKCCSINDEEYTWSTSGSCGGYPVKSEITTEYACETLNSGATSGTGVCCNTSDGDQKWFSGVSTCPDGDKVSLTQAGCGAIVYGGVVCSVISEAAACTGACAWVDCPDGSTKPSSCQPKGTSVSLACSPVSNMPTQDDCLAAFAPNGECDNKCKGRTFNSHVCTDVGEGTTPHWKRQLSDTTTVCPISYTKDCLCPDLHPVEADHNCSSKHAVLKTSISRNEQCTNPEGCYCPGAKDGRNSLNEGEWCPATGGRCEAGDEAVGAICDKRGYRCRKAVGGDLKCIDDSAAKRLLINDSGEVAGVQVPGESVSEKSVLSVRAQESPSTISLSPSQGIYTFEKEGLYCMTYQGGDYCFEVAEAGDVTLYLDSNGNEVYDEGDVNIADDAVELQLSLESAKVIFNFKRGHNMFSLPIVPDGITTTASGILEWLNREYGDAFYSIGKFESGRWIVVENRDGTTYGSDDFQIIPGRGYVIRASADVMVEIDGKSVDSAVPVSLIEGWNLIGVHGTQTTYTASSLIDGIDGVEGLDADNVTEWSSEKSKYEGLQKEQDAGGNEEVYGFDFPIDNRIGYFVRIASGSGTWTPAE